MESVLGRSSREQALRNHERIVLAAGRLLRSRGYDRVGIADVMSAAGMTQGGFYKHFVSKQALAAEAWAAGFEAAAILWRQYSATSSPVESLAKHYFEPKLPEYCCPIIAHGNEAARSYEDGDLQREFAKGVRKLHDVFMDVARNTVSEDHAKVLFAAMIGLNLLSRAVGEEQWVEDLIQSFHRKVVNESS